MNRALLFSRFIKYDILDNFIKSNQSSMILTQTPVDIYIDIQSIYKPVLTGEFIPEDNKVLSINVLNLAGHYRHFFKSRYGVNTRIFIVNSKPNDIFQLVNKTDDQDDIFTIVKKIAPYFPLTYYIKKDNYSASAIIMNTIQTETIPKNASVLVISNDIYSYQIPALIPNAFLIRPSSNTKFVIFNNVIDIMYPRKSSSTVVSDLNPALLPVIMAYHKCPELGMEMLNNFKKTISIIREKISKNQILNGYNSPVVFNKESEEIFKRICLSDLITATKRYANSYESLVNNWKIHKVCDYNVLANILDRKFNTDENNLLNYLFLLDVDQQFCQYMNTL